jgi:anthranilate synthase component 2
MEFMKRARIRVCVIDNEDSFTYNLVQLLEAQNASVMIPLMEKILITCIPTHDILGICLGHQAIAQHFGLKLERKLEVAHGIQEKIEISPKLNPKSILFGISEPIEVGLYHSWYVDRKMSNNILIYSKVS